MNVYCTHKVWLLLSLLGVSHNRFCSSWVSLPTSSTSRLLTDRLSYGIVTKKCQSFVSRPSVSSLHMKSSMNRRKVIDYSNNILEDSTGNINSELAEHIWNWEQDFRTQRNLPKVNYSVRNGLRLVDNLVDNVLVVHKCLQQQSSIISIDEYEMSTLRSDLIQEGLSALLDAMSQYRQHNEYEKNDNYFETFAKIKVYQRLIDSLDLNDISHPIRVPASIKSIIKKAKSISKSITERNGKKPSLQEVAKHMNISIERLKESLSIYRRNQFLLSMESTVSIYNPHDDTVNSYYTDLDEYELQHGLLLDNGIKIDKNELIDEFLDEMITNEGDDEAWIRKEQIVGLLQDSIPDVIEEDHDDENINKYNNDNNNIDPSISIDQNILLYDMIQNQQIFASFLNEILNEQELRIIHLTFGFDKNLKEDTTHKQQIALSSIATKCQLSTREVSHILRNSITKLRKSYQDKYLSPTKLNDLNNHIIEDDIDDMVDSV